MKNSEYRRELPDGSRLKFYDKLDKSGRGQYYDDILRPLRDREGNGALDFICFGKEQSYPNRDLDRVVDHYILHYVTGGCGTYNGKRMTRGCGFLTLPGKRHRIISDSQDPWHFYWIAFGGNDAARQMKSIGLDDAHTCFTFDFFDRLDTLFEDAIYREHADCDIHMYLLGVFYMLMAYHNPPDRTASPGELYARRAAEYINAHFAEPLRISELADRLHVSRKHLCLVFERYAGMSAKEYLLMCRVEAAARLLCTTDMTMPEIAAEVGYGDYTQLSRLFRQKKGVSPQEFRKAVMR